MNKQIDTASIDEPAATVLMRVYKISNRAVARRAGINPWPVIRALDVNEFRKVGHAHVIRARLALEFLLKEAGWNGDPAALWSEYDNKLLDAA